MLGRPPLYAPYIPQLGEKKNSLSSIFLGLSHQDPDIWNIFHFYTWTTKGQLLWGLERQGFRIGSNYGKYSRCKWFLGKGLKRWPQSKCMAQDLTLRPQVTWRRGQNGLAVRWTTSAPPSPIPFLLTSPASNSLTTTVIAFAKCLLNKVPWLGTITKDCVIVVRNPFFTIHLSRDPGHICALPCL